MALSPGLYECIVNHALEDLLSKAREDQVAVSLANLDEGESHILLAQYMAGMIAQSLKKIKWKNNWRIFFMNETELLESTVSEYKNLFKPAKVKTNGKLDTDRLVSNLSKKHDWTYQGAHAIVCLANEYGAFMLRNALALAIVLEKEDGNLGF